MKRNIILKFGIMAFVAILGALFYKIVKNEIAFLAALILTKTITDIFVLQKMRIIFCYW